MSEQTSLSSVGNSKPKIEIRKWYAVAVWSWDLKVDNCAICRNHIMDLCIECQSGSKASDNNPCVVSWGKCNHGFHSHCISKWLKTRDVCPLDNSKWEHNKEYT